MTSGYDNLSDYGEYNKTQYKIFNNIQVFFGFDGIMTWVLHTSIHGMNETGWYRYVNYRM